MSTRKVIATFRNAIKNNKMEEIKMYNETKMPIEDFIAYLNNCSIKEIAKWNGVPISIRTILVTEVALHLYGSSTSRYECSTLPVEMILKIAEIRTEYNIKNVWITLD